MLTLFFCLHLLHQSPENELLLRINHQRQAFGLTTLVSNVSLNKVAQAHARDFVENIRAGSGHRWSDGCEDTECFKRKPQLLSGYPGFAYEIAHYHQPDPGKDICNPDCALQGWNGSRPHYNLIMNNEGWQEFKWKSVGIAIYKGYACVWFGQE